MEDQRGIIYQSSVKGATERESGLDTLYYGTVIRSADPAAVAEAMTKAIGDVLAKLEKREDAIIPADAKVEICSIVDYETLDTVTMIRVPMHRRETGAETKPQQLKFK